MQKKRGKHSFAGNSKNLLFALLVVAAAVTVYGIAQAAVVSHPPSAITPQGAGSGLDADTLQALSAADILSSIRAAGSGEASGDWQLLGIANAIGPKNDLHMSSAGTLPPDAKEIIIIVGNKLYSSGGFPDVSVAPKDVGFVVDSSSLKIVMSGMTVEPRFTLRSSIKIGGITNQEVTLLEEYMESDACSPAKYGPRIVKIVPATREVRFYAATGYQNVRCNVGQYRESDSAAAVYYRA